MSVEIISTGKMKILHDKENTFFLVALKHNEKDENIFKNDLLLFLQQVEIYSPKKVIWDLKEVLLTIHVELQTWIDEVINKREYELGVTTEIFIVPDELIIQLSVEQTMDENYGKNIKTKFFPDYNQALNWLLEN